MTDLTKVAAMSPKEIEEFKAKLFGDQKAPEGARGFRDLDELLRNEQSPQNNSAGERR